MSTVNLLISLAVLFIAVSAKAPWYLVICMAILYAAWSIADAIRDGSNKISDSINDGIRKITEAIKDK